MKTITFSLIFILLSSLSLNVQAKGVAAGAVISNTVIVTANGIPEFGLRATAEFTVAETLNFDLISLDSQAVTVISPSNDRVLSFRLTNTGNGTESFLLKSNTLITDDDFDPIVNSIWIESNQTSSFQNKSSARADSQYLVDLNKVTLDADESVVIYILSRIPKSLGKSQTGKVILKVKADIPNIDQYSVGDSIPAAGDNGVDLVLLKDQGQSQAVGSYITSSLNLDMKKTVFKVIDPYNKKRIMPGTAVTYKISLNATGDGVIENLVISDPTPKNMHYKAGSMILNNISLSDINDNDQGDFGKTQSNTATVVIGKMKSSDHFEILLTYIID